MTDKEKIERIMKLRGLNNTEFANLIGISAGALSHIMSERTKPTLQILRSIKHVSPDINPAWLFYDEEPMMLTDVQSKSNKDNVEYLTDDSISQKSDASYDLFSGLAEQYSVPSNTDTGQVQVGSASSRSRNANGSQITNSSGFDAGMIHNNNVLSKATVPYGSVGVVNIPEIVGETVKQMNKPQRKIVEVRIFFDDGTFEVFS